MEIEGLEDGFREIRTVREPLREIVKGSREETVVCLEEPGESGTRTVR